MSITTELHFRSQDRDQRTPYVVNEESVKYTCDGTEGVISFDGYYYVEDHAPPYPEDDALPEWERPHRRSEYLPQTMELYVKIRETEPYREEHMSTFTRVHYKVLEEHWYKIEIYKRVKQESTDRMSEIEEDDGPMSVCFFPTNKQILYFRVLEVLK
jgi:hypothetical protein